jgi:hypothetical protein
MIYKVMARLLCSSDVARLAMADLEAQTMTSPIVELEHTDLPSECALSLTWPQIEAPDSTEATGVWDALVEEVPTLRSAASLSLSAISRVDLEAATWA